MFIHGFLLMEGHKMSKSLGNVLDPDEVIAKFGADALRFYCFREVSFGQDGQISPAGFESRYESELADQYGNLANRVLSMIGRYRDGVVPEAEAESELAGDLEGAPERVRALLDEAELTQALEEIWRARAPPQPVRGGDEALGSLQGRVGVAAAWTRCSTGWRRACASPRSCSTPTCRRRPAACSTRSRSPPGSLPISAPGAAARSSASSPRCSRSSRPA